MARPKSNEPKYSLAKRENTYYIQWWEDGRSRRVSCRTENQTEARRFLASFGAHLTAPVIPQSPTVGRVITGYEEHRAERRHSPTLKYDCASLRRHLSDLPTDLLSRERIDFYCRSRRKEGAGGASAQYRKVRRELSDGTLIRELGTLRTALSWAVAEKWITTAPVVHRPEAPPPRDRWLNEVEYKRLLDSAVAPHIRLFVSLAIYTAARTGAILTLEWDRVDFIHGQIDMGRGRGKKRRARVPMTDQLRTELQTARDAATTPFVIEYGGAPVASVKTAFRAAARRAELPGVTAHVLRHTAATWMVQRSVPLAMVAAYLGNSVQMVERVYGHHSPEWLQLAADALSRPSWQRK